MNTIRRHSAHASCPSRTPRSHGRARRRLAAAAPLGLVLAGCQTGHTFVLKPPPPGAAYRDVAIRQGESTVTIPSDLQEHFEKRLSERLPAGQSSQEDLTLEYRLVLHDPGHKGARIGAALVNLTGLPTGALGWGLLGVEVVYRDVAGTEVARILADGPIDGPLGSSRRGLTTAADSIVSFTRTHLVRGQEVDRPAPANAAAPAGEITRRASIN